MKKIAPFLPILWLTFLGELSYSQTRVMTYNIRLNHPGDQENVWEIRKGEVAEMILYYHPEFLGIQEGLPEQVSYLDSMLTSWTYIGIGRNGAGQRGESVVIFYDSTRFELLKTNTFWLSETPDTVSLGWDAAYNRISTYGAFRNRTNGDTLHLFNCHLDHMGEIARERSAALLLAKHSEYGLDEKQVIIMGDFNATPEDKPIQIMKSMLKDAQEISEKPVWGPPGTYNDFDTQSPVVRRIDYIFVNRMAIWSYRHIDDRRDNLLWLSDHLPVLAELKDSKP